MGLCFSKENLDVEREANQKSKVVKKIEKTDSKKDDVRQKNRECDDSVVDISETSKSVNDDIERKEGGKDVKKVSDCDPVKRESVDILEDGTRDLGKKKVKELKKEDNRNLSTNLTSDPSVTPQVEQDNEISETIQTENEELSQKEKKIKKIDIINGMISHSNFQLETLEEMNLTFHSSKINSMSIFPPSFIVTSSDETICVDDCDISNTTMRSSKKIRPHRKQSSGINNDITRFDDHHLLTCGNDGNVYSYDIKSPTTIKFKLELSKFGFKSIKRILKLHQPDLFMCLCSRTKRDEMGFSIPGEDFAMLLISYSSTEILKTFPDCDHYDQNSKMISSKSYSDCVYITESISKKTSSDDNIINSFGIDLFNYEEFEAILKSFKNHGVGKVEEISVFNDDNSNEYLLVSTIRNRFKSFLWVYDTLTGDVIHKIRMGDPISSISSQILLGERIFILGGKRGRFQVCLIEVILNDDDDDEEEEEEEEGKRVLECSVDFIEPFNFDNKKKIVVSGGISGVEIFGDFTGDDLYTVVSSDRACKLFKLKNLKSLWELFVNSI